MKTIIKDKVRLFSCVMIAISLTFLTSQSFSKQQEYKFGNIPLPQDVYRKYLKKHSEIPALNIEAVTATDTDLPTSYDARIYGLVTPAKNQGNCGSCWAFASVGALESHLLKTYSLGPEDVSEQQLVSCAGIPYLSLGCSGGTAFAIQYWERNDPFKDIYFQYTESDTTGCKTDDGNQLKYWVENFHSVFPTESEFKKSLYNDGPSFWNFLVYQDFLDYWRNGALGDVYTNKSSVRPKDGNGKELLSPPGHAVLLIGWDDSKGAYLCKNSWGENSGPNGDGTFWIAYDGHSNNLGFGMFNFSVTNQKNEWLSAYQELLDTPSDLDMMRQYRNEILSKTNTGKLYVEELYKNSEEALKVLNDNPELMNRAGELIQANKDAVADVLAQGNGTIYDADAITNFLADYAKASPPDLRFLVNKVRVDMKKHKQEKKQFFGFTLE